MYDITIIGSGPAGLFSGFYAGLCNAKVQILESLDGCGGQLTSLYNNKVIYDVGGFTGIRSSDLVESLKKQVKQVNVPIKLNESVINVIKKKDDTYIVETTKKKYITKGIVLAVGKGEFQARKLNCDNNISLSAKSKIFYDTTELPNLKNKVITIVGGGDTALDNAIILSKIARKVILINRSDNFRGFNYNIQQLRELPNVEFKTPYFINDVKDKEDRLQIILKLSGSDALSYLDSDYLIVNYGVTSKYDFIDEWDIDLKRHDQFLAVNQNLKTSHKNMYAIGDTVDYLGKKPLISMAFGEGSSVINQLMDNLYPGQSHGPVHSTDLEI